MTLALVAMRLLCWAKLAPLVLFSILLHCHSLPRAEKTYDAGLEGYRYAEFSQNNNGIVAIRGQKMVLINQQGKEVFARGGFSQPYSQVTSNGRILAAISGNQIHLLTMQGKVIQKFGKTFDSYEKIAFAPAGNQLVAIKDAQLFFLNLRKDKIVKRIEIGDAGNDFTWVQYSNDGKKLITVKDEKLRVIDAITGRRLYQWGGITDVYQRAHFGAGDKYIAALQQGKLIFIDLKGNVLTTIKSTSEQISDIAFTKDGSRLLLIASGKIKIFAMADLKVKVPEVIKHDENRTFEQRDTIDNQNRGRPSR